MTGVPLPDIALQAVSNPTVGRDAAEKRPLHVQVGMRLYFRLSAGGMRVAF